MICGGFAAPPERHTYAFVVGGMCWQVEAAAAVGLPTEPLVQKALEGAAKGTAGAGIVRAVRRLNDGMLEARGILGRDAPEAELVAGAVALLAGAPAAALDTLAQARPEGDVVVPLVVLADLVRRGVAAPEAAGLVTRLASAGVSDDGFIRLRLLVQGDIEHCGGA